MRSLTAVYHIERGVSDLASHTTTRLFPTSVRRRMLTDKGFTLSGATGGNIHYSFCIGIVLQAVPRWLNRVACRTVLITGCLTHGGEGSTASAVLQGSSLRVVGFAV